MKTYSFYKELTAAEVGETGTHEIYVRFPNNFDYETFFHGSAVENGTVIEVSFEAQDLTDNVNSKVNLRFVYYVNNTNKEKRMPGLSNLFRGHQIKQGDIVCLESRIEDDEVSYYLRFYRKGEIEINPTSVVISRNEDASFHNFSRKFPKELPLQQIYYGAPGTGKSNTIKGLTNKDNSKRITFHPDSDYASFVGCYKPTVEPIKCGAYKELEELKEEAKTINESPDEKVAQVIAFVTKYANDLQHVVETNPEVGSLQNLLKTYLGFNSNTYLAYVVDYVLKNQKKEITYKFCSQAFTDAYVEAWKDRSKPYYLVIEEINRGNCAQIFGDIFQLLDRGDDGNSSYEITPDKDLQQYLAEKFENEEIVDKDIKDGVKMRLPSNLYILATMNTSDQSLFPIDSAFKRRWDWKYIPIKNEGKNYKIVVGEATYDWWNFVKFVNDRIESVTDSEDKQIGYWFAKANEEGKISAETLVSKVLFYLWNDVFKDYTHNTSSLFQTKKRKYKFREFYLENGDVKIDLLNQFLLELEFKNETSQPEETQSTEE